MVNYTRPKYITKTALANANEFAFTAARLAPDAPEPRVPTCTRCLVGIAKYGTCDKPEGARCEHCVDGNRGSCTLVCLFT
jgi:hypothetical protein